MADPGTDLASRGPATAGSSSRPPNGATGMPLASCTSGMPGEVSRFVLSRTGDRPLAEDLTSETFLRALRRIESVSDQGRDVGAWFTTIARNLTVDHVKSSRYRLERTTADLPDRSPRDNRGPEQAVIDKETAAELRHHIAKLLPDQQECLRLRFGQDLSSAQTAAAMGRTDSAVRALRHRAIGGLRASLARPSLDLSRRRGRALRFKPGSSITVEDAKDEGRRRSLCCLGRLVRRRTDGRDAFLMPWRGD